MKRENSYVLDESDRFHREGDSPESLSGVDSLVVKMNDKFQQHQITRRLKESQS
jgi:hypothetical protein